MRYARLARRALPALFMAAASCQSDSTTGPVVTRVFIDQVTLLAMPFVDQGGIAWDFTSGPDPYFYLVASPTTVAVTTRTTAAADITPGSLPITWVLSPAFEIADFQQGYFLQLNEFDPLDPDDIVGTTSAIRAQDLLFYKPGTFDLMDPSGTIRFRLTLRYQ